MSACRSIRAIVAVVMTLFGALIFADATLAQNAAASRGADQQFAAAAGLHNRQAFDLAADEWATFLKDYPADKRYVSQQTQRAPNVLSFLKVFPSADDWQKPCDVSDNAWTFGQIVSEGWKMRAVDGQVTNLRRLKVLKHPRRHWRAKLRSCWPIGMETMKCGPLEWVD